MSAPPMFIPRHVIADVRHPMEEAIDWKRYETLASEEVAPPQKLTFSETSRERIIEGLRAQTRNQDVSDTVTVEDMKKRLTHLRQLMPKGLPDPHLLAKNSSHLPSEFLKAQTWFDHLAFERAMIHTFEVAHQKTVLQRLSKYQKSLRENPRSMALKLPRPESIAVYEIHQVFEECGMRAKISHTRPSATPERSEVLGAFELFCFEYVMPELGSDDLARKALRRNLAEAEKAIIESAKQIKY